MLFDLRGRGRRRTIQAIYLALAILMGGGLVLFGIGGNTSGGLLDAFREDQQTQSDGTSRRIDAAEKRITTNPRNAAAWAQLARLRVQQASIVGFEETTGTFNDDGKAELVKAERAWDRYLALEPKKPDARVANLMASQVFGPAGLNKLDKAVAAFEIVTESRPPTWQLYTQLAELAYAAGQTRKGDLARQEALARVPKVQRSLVKNQLDQAKARGALSSSAAPTG